MKKILLSSVIGSVALGFFVVRFLLFPQHAILGDQNKNTPPNVEQQNYPTPKPSKNEQISYSDESKLSGIPQRLIIPKIGVDAAVEPLGLDAQDKMDVPKQVNDVGWYKLGFKPGEKGSAVIDGHLDSQARPAIFYRLSDLEVGDLIKVVDSKGHTYNFTVTEKAVYLFDQVPLDQVFGQSDTKRLNLITCGGRFNGVTRNYSHRIVVYSELANQ